MPSSYLPSTDKRVAVLKALAHPSRLRITEALMQGEKCVAKLRDLVGSDVSTVSKHLSLLRTAGVLVSEKRGLNVYYRLGCTCFGDFLRCVDQVGPDLVPAQNRSVNCC